MTVTETIPFNYTTHNGEITIQNRETGEHRTLRIRTQKADANFAPGERILSLFTGCENESDKSYTNFAFIKSDGRIILWSRFRDSRAFQAYAGLVANPEALSHKYEFMYAGRCRRCNRKLTNPESVSTGLGPECGNRR